MIGVTMPAPLVTEIATAMESRIAGNTTETAGNSLNLINESALLSSEEPTANCRGFCIWIQDF